MNEVFLEQLTSRKKLYLNISQIMNLYQTTSGYSGTNVHQILVKMPPLNFLFKILRPLSLKIDFWQQ